MAKRIVLNTPTQQIGPEVSKYKVIAVVFFDDHVRVRFRQLNAANEEVGTGSITINNLTAINNFLSTATSVADIMNKANNLVLTKVAGTIEEF